MIDLLNIEPNVVSKDLKNYVIGIYGDPGCGKTSLAAKVPRSLLVATEIGYKAISGIKAVPALNYSALLTVLNQLKKQEVKDEFDVVIIDTMDAMFYITENEVLRKNGVTALNDIPYGGGHNQLLAIWQLIIKTIIHEGYGLILLGHRAVKTDDDKIQYNTLALNNKKVKGYIMSEVDIMAYVASARGGETSSRMFFRSSQEWEAKARFKEIAESAPFSYDDLVKVVHEAVVKVEPDATDERIDFYDENNKATYTVEDFNKLKNETELIAKNLIDADANSMGKVVETIDKYLGKKIGNAVPSDGERMELLKEALQGL